MVSHSHANGYASVTHRLRVGYASAGLLYELATMEKHPESVPINALVPIDGTPMGGTEEVEIEGMGEVRASARRCHRCQSPS